MKIYTKTGDAGETSLFGGGRVSKSAARIEAYGTVDELNAQIGLTRSFEPAPRLTEMLTEIQSELFVLGADLATPEHSKAQVERISASHSQRLETWIDELEESLPALRFFILPGGSSAASSLHIARTVCRRAERRVITAREHESISEQCVIYLNRLSDLLFVMTRYENKSAGIQEDKWQA